MLVNQHDEIFTPSVVLFDGDERIVGREAVRQMTTLHDHVAYEVKRDMGHRFYSRPILDRQLPPEVIQACILRSLRSDILRRLKGNYQVVITVPAYFDESRRTATLAAGRLAELNVLDIVNEPTAAALAFGERLGFLKESGLPRAELNVLVYDLGGGTFDCTIVKLSPGQITTIATDGDMQLGGSDWDHRLLDLATRKLRNQHGLGDQALHGLQPQLLRLVIEAKHTLSTRNEASVRLDVKGRAIVLNITRNEFEQQTADLVERTAFTTRQVLAAAKLKWSQIDRLLLVGGATRMPMIRLMLEVASGKSVDTTVNPDEAVARGAAIFAQYQLTKRGINTSTDGLSITDVNAHTLGIEGLNLKTKAKENTHIIPRNTPLPCVVHRKFVTKKANQQTVNIQVLEGESKSLDGAIRLGRAVIRNLPSNLPAKHPIDVEYRYNTNGQLEVRAQVQGHGAKAHIELQRTRDFSDARMAAWKQVVCDDGGFDDFEAVMMELIEDETSEYTPEDLVPKTKPRKGSPLSYRLADSASSESGFLDDTKPLVHEAKADPTPVAPAAPTARPTLDSLAPMAPVAPGSTNAPASASEEITKDTSVEQPAQRIAAPAPTPAQPQTRLSDSPTQHRRQKSKNVGLIVNVLGFFLFSVLGLVIGYYLLVTINPSANFLNLNLPGISTDDTGTSFDPTD